MNSTLHELPDGIEEYGGEEMLYPDSYRKMERSELRPQKLIDINLVIY